MPKKKEVKKEVVVKSEAKEPVIDTVSISLETVEIPILEKMIEIAKSGVPDSSIVMLANKIKAQIDKRN